MSDFLDKDDPRYMKSSITLSGKEIIEKLGQLDELVIESDGEPIYLSVIYADEPPFDENHYRYHTPAGPNPECDNCKWLNWSQPDHD